MIVMCGGEVPGDLPLLLKGFQSRDKDFKSNSSLISVTRNLRELWMVCILGIFDMLWIYYCYDAVYLIFCGVSSSDIYL